MPELSIRASTLEAMFAPPSLTETVATAAEFLRRKFAPTPAANARIGIVLGSGLGAFADQLRQAVSISYREIPYFPPSCVPGHEGRLVAGVVSDTPVIVLQGRVHGYEGYSAEQLVFHLRTLGFLGVEAVVLTNAAGAIRLDLRPGQFVLISDHINLTGQNPAASSRQAPTLVHTEPTAKWNRAETSSQAQRATFGPRFFDMSDAYSRRLRELAQAAAAAELGTKLAEGVYLGVSGPSFETPAEIRAFRAWGADLVGMSTVLETIAARQMGIEVLGLSCVTNMAAGVEATPLSHEEVMQTGHAVESQLTALLKGIVPRIAKGLAQAHPTPAGGA
jgi:purine-nucleoside phosphorylase